MANEESPPVPGEIPLLGNGLAFARDPVGAIERFAAHGDVAALRIRDSRRTW